MVDDKNHHEVRLEGNFVIIEPETSGVRAANMPLPIFYLNPQI
jgi:hypothetical protein